MQHHKFKIGQSVSFTSGPFGRGSPNDIYKIVQLLPLEGYDYQYRTKSANERTNGLSRKAPHCMTSEYAPLLCARKM